MGKIKLIISIVVSVLIIIMGIFIFRDKIEMTETEKMEESVKAKVIALQFKDITYVDYKDHMLIIKGRKEEKDHTYYYDLNNKKLVEYMEEKELILPDDIKGDLYKYSKDKTKVLYINTKNRLISYNIKKDFKREIKVEVDDYVLKNFKKKVLISPMAGYISIEYDKENEQFFSVYGADSGRKYKEDIYGYNLSWADDDSKLCYVLSKEGDLKDRKIGYYNIKTKKLDYLDLKDKIISKIYFKGDDIDFIVEGNVLVFYSFNDNKVKKINLHMMGEVFNYSADTLICNKEEKIVKKIDENYNISVYKDLLDMKDDDYFYKDDEYFIYFNQEGIHIENHKTKTIIELDKNFSIFKSIKE